MMKKIIQIDREKCIGCGACANTCHQSSIQIIDGKAEVVRADFCDGLGRCLPVCPVSAISFVDVDVQSQIVEEKPSSLHCQSAETKATQTTTVESPSSQLNQWPVQLQLVSVTAPFLANSHLLVSADCAAFSYSNFHEEFMKNKITLIACPKLDNVEHSEKITQIITENEIESVTVVRMEVPCCGGIERAVHTALENSQKKIPFKVATMSVEGKILEYNTSME